VGIGIGKRLRRAARRDLPLLLLPLGAIACASETAVEGGHSPVSITQRIAVTSTPGYVHRPLGADALRTLLSGVNVTPVSGTGEMMSHPPGEIFRSDGVYMEIRNRTTVDGTFRIEGNSVCVEGGDIERLCRRVIVLENNTYLLVNRDDGSVKLVEITPHG
jgi:hypothetical protein